MAADSPRRRDERLPSTDGETSADERSAEDAGETLAEKIQRYRQRGPGAAGGASGPGSRVVRSPRGE